VPLGRPRASILTTCKWVLVGAALVVALPYAWGPIYRFPAPTVFSGAHFLNPYEGLHRRWQRANLHAHGRAWSGLTNGQQSDEEVIARYKGLGYAVAGISDYQRIATLHGVPTMPLYEHGYNIGKHHQLAIGAHHVEWFDFLLWQSVSNEQYIIDRVAETTDLVALAHPLVKGAYTRGDLQQLTGYKLLEIINGPWRMEAGWDAALSTGHIVWALANDDTHDLNDPQRTAAAWNMIDAPTTSTSDVVSALRAGRAYAVARHTGDTNMDTTVSDVDMSADRLTVTCAGEPATFVFVGQNGGVRKTVKNVVSADYTFDPGDTYIRTVIHSPRTTIYLNPIVRYDGVNVPMRTSTVDAASTWTLRGACLAIGLTALALPSRRRRARPSPAAVVVDRPNDFRRKTA